MHKCSSSLIGQWLVSITNLLIMIIHCKIYLVFFILWFTQTTKTFLQWKFLDLQYFHVQRVKRHLTFYTIKLWPSSVLYFLNCSYLWLHRKLQIPCSSVGLSSNQFCTTSIADQSIFRRRNIPCFLNFFLPLIRSPTTNVNTAKQN